MQRLLKFGKSLLLILYLFASSEILAADEKLSLKAEGYLVKVVENGGQKDEQMFPLPEKVYPGDVIEYRIRATNVSNEDLKEVVIRAKIPRGTVYIPGSASDSPEFSIDMGKSFSKEPVKYTLRVDGKEVVKVATPDMYTNIRWKLEVLKPGEKRIFRYRVRVKPGQKN